jgi:hypothetical protein
MGETSLLRRAPVLAFPRSCAPLVSPRIGALQRCAASSAEVRTPRTGGWPVFGVAQRTATAVLILLAAASLELFIPPQGPLTGLTLSGADAAVKHNVNLL